MAAIIPTLARHGHRQRALKSLICNIGRQTTTHNLPPCIVHRAAFTTTHRTKNESTNRAPSYSAIDESDRVAREEEGESKPEIREHFVPIDRAQPSPPESDSTSHVPWYLQVQQPTAPERPASLSSQQKIPELPSDPPPLLSPLLEYVSVELGMDYLSLLDLRAIEPPPALGANLLMIVGTARSEKHLHVSADRLCRWLRTNYKLRPYADGLLGRNELKLKVRRRNKRTRMLSAVGASPTADTEVDEGIRTGWVCVNVGRVEGGDAARVAGQAMQDEEAVGFGGQVGGSNIVVQLLTEEKRGEVDLEKLWTGLLKRSLRDAEGADGQEEYDEAWPEEEGSERTILQHNDALAPSEGPRATA